MYELLSEVKTRPYLKDVNEQRLPSIQRRSVQARDLQLGRMQPAEAGEQATGGSRGGQGVGQLGARVLSWLTVTGMRSSGHV